MIRKLLAATIFLLGATAVVAQSDPLSARKALMKDNGKGTSALNKMVRGEEPFDAGKVTAAFAQWSETAQKLSALFPEPPKPGEDSRALPKIWENKADFDAKIAAFGKVVADNKDKANTLEGLQAAFPLVTKTCGDCHEPYRKPQQR